MSAPTLLTPYGYSSSACGYCSPSGSRSAEPSSKKYGLEAPQMSCQFYQAMIDRGWRRSGDYVYHPDMAHTCCPQYTIRLDAQAFKATKKHRQVVNRWNRHLAGKEESSETKAKGKGKAPEWDLEAEMKKYEEGFGELGEYLYSTELVPAKATDETFQLYKRYQVAVHKDPPEKISMRGFQRFLCDSPLIESAIAYNKEADTSKLPAKYGSYHLLYRIDGKLVGISVIDILPSCVSSVYFIWDPDYAWASLGKLSALREVVLARDMRSAGAEGMGWVYMGYWIPDCQKMVYKSEYGPSYLLDPDTHVFHLLSPQLDAFLKAHPKGYFPFKDVATASVNAASPEKDNMAPKDEDDSDSEMSDVEEMDAFPDGHVPGFTPMASISDDFIGDLLVLMKGKGSMRNSRLIAVDDLAFGDQEGAYGQIRELVSAVGMDLVGRKSPGLDGLKDKGVLYFG